MVAGWEPLTGARGTTEDDVQSFGSARQHRRIRGLIRTVSASEVPPIDDHRAGAPDRSQRHANRDAYRHQLDAGARDSIVRCWTVAKESRTGELRDPVGAGRPAWATG